ncbi:transcriptional regulator [Candidatus Amesbacteria bacterium RIFCSPHIGHO2_01_FULL_48_32]|uniref:Transcriptional regulator n=1 Tax=Candidatus Amesbacteria bacterium RIFCSPLOWO2_01_FULL_48_25 TaxID=1797259 RepID=A0A1F4ZBX6_9BACT|nr:MAG: transcriptional regulator [Candidatus Amesbacteria bacterium RIFCSPHIGHO2_01_FULL_48_32]OGD03793.1 MAG: transcriptional regulator [Candidatus Amesbacteria bacterium RIFCSPLOWO2_01_FULL_48_25]HJZ05099.1 Zn-ribbon domain-containing OB-fold protein [Patescibacteria group bacterium]
MEISRYWRLQKARYGLVGEVCTHCKKKIFPPRDVCPTCAAEAKTPYQFSGKGKIYSHTTIYDAPEGFENHVPYTVAHIKLEEGPIITAQLTDIDRKYKRKGDALVLIGLVDVFGKKVDIGTPVEMVTRFIKEDGGSKGMLVYGYKFRPVLATE